MPAVNQPPPDPGAAAQPTIDVLGDALAVLDQAGVIVHANAAWQRHACRHGAVAGPLLPGASFLDACERAAAAMPPTWPGPC